MDKECLILVPLSDLFRPGDFYGFDRFEISHFLTFLTLSPTPFDACYAGYPFSAKMQDKGFNFFMLSPAKMGHFFLEFALFSLIKTQMLSLEGMMNV